MPAPRLQTITGFKLNLSQFADVRMPKGARVLYVEAVLDSVTGVTSGMVFAVYYEDQPIVSRTFTTRVIGAQQPLPDTAVFVPLMENAGFPVFVFDLGE